MRRRLAFLVLAGSLALCAPAALAQGAGPEIAGILKENPVYADPTARPTLTPAQAERIRLRIAERAPGRIAIAVVSARAARAAGGVRELSRAIDRDFDVNGALLVIDSQSDNAWVIVSYDDPGLAVHAVQSAFAGKASFDAHVTKAVDRLAAADPGPGTPGGGPQTPATSTPHTDVDVESAAKTVLVVVLAVIAGIVLLIGVLVLMARAARRRRNEGVPGGFEVAPPPTPPTDSDAQRQAAEKAFGSEDP